MKGTTNMTDESKQEDNLSQNQQIHAALMHLAAPERTRMLSHLHGLREELKLIPLSDTDAVEVVGITQDLLKIWNDELDRILAAEKARDTYGRLSNWDNEGGRNG
jgi:hypothetical protein